MKKYQIIYADPTPEVLRDCINNGQCWWCGRNGWRRLAQHTSMVHSIYADDIRKMAIMLKRAPTCIEEETKILSERRLRLLKEGKVRIPDWRLGVSVKHEYSEAGLESLRAKMPIMVAGLTDVIKARALRKAAEVNRRPHPCRVCGKIIPRAKPLLCSPSCRLVEKQKNARDAGITRKRLASESPKYKLRMSQVEQHQKYKRPHKCLTCGKIIMKSRPRYCSLECASRKLQLPMDNITNLYLSGISLIKISRMYNCSARTIDRRLKEIGSR